MKWLIYFKALSLILILSMDAALAMEEEESSHVVQPSRRVPRTLKELCVKKIKGRLRDNPFFAFEEAQRFKQKYNELDPYEVLDACQLIHGKPKEDPPFFCLKGDGKEIYVLGSQHIVPIHRCLAYPTLVELRRISELRPAFYMEHESTNKPALALLKQTENQIEAEMMSGMFKFDFLYQIGLPQEVGKEFKECVKGKPFLLKMTDANVTEVSDVEILEVLKAKIWLGAVLLGSHANILSYQKYGGLETELMYDAFWRTRWHDQRFLETDIELIATQKKHEKGGADITQNMSWAQTSIRSIIPFIKSNEETLEELTSKMWVKKLNGYSWEVINYSKRNEIPESVIERQAAWADKLLQDIRKEPEIPIRLVVVGNGHLPGYAQKWSFLSFLNKELNWPLFRFSNKEGWVPVK